MDSCFHMGSCLEKMLQNGNSLSDNFVNEAGSAQSSQTDWENLTKMKL